MSTENWPKRDPNTQSDFTPCLIHAPDAGIVYFIGSDDGTKVKAGYGSGWQRVERHLTEPVSQFHRVLAVVRGSRNSEAAVKKYFAKQTVNKGSEVFNADPTTEDGNRLRSYLVWLRDIPYVATSKEEFDSVERQKVMEPEFWLPKPERVSGRRSEANLLTLSDPWAEMPTRTITGDDWYTDGEIIERVKLAFDGVIELDPATHIMCNGKYIQARRIFTESQNGLVHQWTAKTVFLNPPFSKGQLFAEKVIEEYAARRFGALIFLGGTRSLSNQYMRPLLDISNAMCVVTGRRPFWGLSTEAEPVDGWFLLHIGENPERFEQAMTGIGAVSRFVSRYQRHAEVSEVA